MTCVHLRQLYKLCEDHHLKLGSADLIRVVCHQCGEQEVCPSTMTDEYDARQRQAELKKAAGKGAGDASSNMSRVAGVLSRPSRRETMGTQPHQSRGWQFG